MEAQRKDQLPIRLRVNGRTHELFVEPREFLVEVLRNRLGLTGTKLSCDMEVCGACTVLLDGKPISSCTLLAYEARDKDILTIEGLSSDGKLHPLQEAFIEHGAVQCGFCTSGMILTAKTLLDENPEPTEEIVKQYLRGNLCRCTGYKKIVEAVLSVAK